MLITEGTVNNVVSTSNGPSIREADDNQPLSDLRAKLVRNFEEGDIMFRLRPDGTPSFIHYKSTLAASNETTPVIVSLISTTTPESETISVVLPDFDIENDGNLVAFNGGPAVPQAPIRTEKGEAQVDLRAKGTLGGDVGGAVGPVKGSITGGLEIEVRISGTTSQVENALERIFGEQDVVTSPNQSVQQFYDFRKMQCRITRDGDPFESDVQFLADIFVGGQSVLDEILRVGMENIDATIQAGEDVRYHFIKSDIFDVTPVDESGQVIPAFLGADAFILEQGGTLSFGIAVYNDPVITGRQFLPTDVVAINLEAIASPPDNTPVEMIWQGGLISEVLGDPRFKTLPLQLTDDRESGVVVGSADVDSVLGRAGDDLIVGSQSGDNLDGQSGIDAVAYNASDARVVVNLGTGGGRGGDAAGDTLQSIENLFGSEFNDTLIGSKEANVLGGGPGRDLLRGAGGDDAASYADSAASVLVDLGRGTARGGDAEGDRLRSIENLVGSEFDDRLIGDEDENVLFGGVGRDFLAGRGGSDTLNGGLGNDRLDGGAEEDRFEFFAGEGDDRIRDFESGSDKIAIADFLVPEDGLLLFEDLDTNNSGTLDQPDEAVSVRDVNRDGTPDLVLDLTPFAPTGASSKLTLLSVSELTPDDFA